MIGYSETSSNDVLITCDNISVGGTVLTNTFQCINSPATATLSSNTGSVIAWESTSNNWFTTNTITTTNTLIATLSSLTTTTQIRAAVKNGVCPVVYSNSIAIRPAANSVGGNISGTQSVCAISNAATLTLSNYTGTILNWESASSFGGPFNLISNTSNTISFNNLSQDTWYRALVKNGTCAATNSSLFSVQVDQASTGGNITGTQNVCSGINSGTLQLIAQTGSVTHWQNSTNNGSTWNTIVNSTNLLLFSNLSSSSVYRAIVQNGLCPASNSANFSITVNPKPLTNFTVNSSCVQTSIPYSNTTTGNNSYVWDFGDGGSSNIYSPNHVYSTAGTFTVKLIAVSFRFVST